MKSHCKIACLILLSAFLTVSFISNSVLAAVKISPKTIKITVSLDKNDIKIKKSSGVTQKVKYPETPVEPEYVTKNISGNTLFLLFNNSGKVYIIDLKTYKSKYIGCIADKQEREYTYNRSIGDMNYANSYNNYYLIDIPLKETELSLNTDNESHYITVFKDKKVEYSNTVCFSFYANKNYYKETGSFNFNPYSNSKSVFADIKNGYLIIYKFNTSEKIKVKTDCTTVIKADDKYIIMRDDKKGILKIYDIASKKLKVPYEKMYSNEEKGAVGSQNVEYDYNPTSDQYRFTKFQVGDRLFFVKSDGDNVILKRENGNYLWNNAEFLKVLNRLKEDFNAGIYVDEVVKASEFFQKELQEYKDASRYFSGKSLVYYKYNVKTGAFSVLNSYKESK